MKKKVLVIGGCGFIGSNLCKALSKDYQVTSLDNYFTGKRKNEHPGVVYIDGNSSEIFQKINFQPFRIYHLGEYSRVEQSIEDWEKVFEYNGKSFFEVIKFAIKSKSKLIYAGSSTKFGDGGNTVLTSPYAWTKSKNTELLKTINLWVKLDFAIVYFYNVYGQGEIEDGKYATLIAKFIKLKKQNKPLTVVKPGTQRRNFTHIDDIINGVIMVGDNGVGDGYGIGSSESYSILELVELFNSEYVFIEKRKGNRMSAELVTSKTESLGWKAQKTLKNYIKEIFE